jgi:hypothetical protein
MFAALLVAACTLTSHPLVGQSKGSPGGPSNNPQSVLVINGPGAPVPTTATVSGTVSLASGSTVNIANTPNVNVSNMPNVNVANTPTVSLAAGATISVTNPLDGQNNPTPVAMLEATQPYEDICAIQFNGTEDGTCHFLSIPSGKRLVIQEFNASGQFETGLKPIFVGLQPAVNVYAFPSTFMGTRDGFDFFATHQETRLYGGAARAPSCSVSLSGISNSGICICAFSGFLVDVP